MTKPSTIDRIQVETAEHNGEISGRSRVEVETGPVGRRRNARTSDGHLAPTTILRMGRIKRVQQHEASNNCVSSSHTLLQRDLYYTGVNCTEPPERPILISRVYCIPGMSRCDLRSTESALSRWLLHALNRTTGRRNEVCDFMISEALCRYRSGCRS